MAASATSAPRIVGMDFMRGVAVLGILTMNVTGFWGPSLATFSPLLPRGDAGGTIWFALAFVVFDGKMRGLFTLLFGASMVLFIRAAERRGINGDAMQARRLLWLALFGYAHYLLLWWGDILFPYALCGLGALALRRLSPQALLTLATMLFLVAHGLDAIGDLPGIAAEQRVLAGTGTPMEVGEQAVMMDRIAQSLASDTRILDADFLHAIGLRLAVAPWMPFTITLTTLTETLPLMLAGMALLRTGFFTGGWSEAALGRIAMIGVGIGGSLTLALLAWAWSLGFAPRAMFGIISDVSAIPRAMMTFGYAALLMIAWPRVVHAALVRHLVAAGRCAFTNYLGTTVLMAALFSGWGLGLGAQLPRGWLPPFILAGWAAMLAWPAWWLARFRQGPMEALWRRLTWIGTRNDAG